MHGFCRGSRQDSDKHLDNKHLIDISIGLGLKRWEILTVFHIFLALKQGFYLYVSIRYGFEYKYGLVRIASA